MCDLSWTFQENPYFYVMLLKGTCLPPVPLISCWTFHVNSLKIDFMKIDGHTYRQQTGGRTDGQTDGYTKQTGRRTDRQIAKGQTDNENITFAIGTDNNIREKLTHFIFTMIYMWLLCIYLVVKLDSFTSIAMFVTNKAKLKSFVLYSTTWVHYRLANIVTTWYVTFVTQQWF